MTSFERFPVAGNMGGDPGERVALPLGLRRSYMFEMRDDPSRRLQGLRLSGRRRAGALARARAPHAVLPQEAAVIERKVVDR